MLPRSCSEGREVQQQECRRVSILIAGRAVWAAHSDRSAVAPGHVPERTSEGVKEKMKRFMAIAAALTLVSAMSASADSFTWTENFESGLSAWTEVNASGSYPVTVSTDQAVSPTHSARTADAPTGATGLGYIWHQVDNAEKDFDLTWSFYDTNAANTGQRNWIQVMNYSDGGITGTLNQLFAIGAYNAVLPTDVYQARILYGGTAPYTAWFGTSVSRATGWHTARIKQEGTTGLLTMWIDSTQVAQVNLPQVNVFPLTVIRAGSGLSNNGAGMYFDDITFVTPEPGSMVALGAGLLSMVGLIRRKK